MIVALLEMEVDQDTGGIAYEILGLFHVRAYALEYGRIKEYQANENIIPEVEGVDHAKLLSDYYEAVKRNDPDVVLYRDAYLYSNEDVIGEPGYRLQLVEVSVIEEFSREKLLGLQWESVKS